MAERKQRYSEETFHAIKDKYYPRLASDFYHDFVLISATNLNDVYQAIDDDGNSVAIKFVKFNVSDIPLVSMLKELDIVRRRFVTTESPFLLEPKDIVYDESQRVGIVTAWAEFGSLNESIYTFPKDGAVIGSFGMQLALGLQELHSNNIVHRDFKPENIFVSRGDDEEFKRYQIGDFGMSAILSYLKKEQTTANYGISNIPPDLDMWNERYTPVGHVVGTPSYMSPEQASGKKLTMASDVFVLGTLLYEAVIGGRAFLGKTPQEIMRNIVSVSLNDTDCFKNVPLTGLTNEKQNRFKQIILSLLSSNPKDRGCLTDKKLETAVDIAKEIALLWEEDTSAHIKKTEQFNIAMGIQKDNNTY